MPGTFSLYRTWSDGDSFNGSDITSSFQTFLTNMTPAGMDDYSQDATQMRVTTDPFPASAESLATSLQGEIERIRYQLNAIIGGTYWYSRPASTLATGTGGGFMEAQIFS